MMTLVGWDERVLLFQEMETRWTRQRTRVKTRGGLSDGVCEGRVSRRGAMDDNARQLAVDTSSK